MFKKTKNQLIEINWLNFYEISFFIKEVLKIIKYKNIFKNFYKFFESLKVVYYWILNAKYWLVSKNDFITSMIIEYIKKNWLSGDF